MYESILALGLIVFMLLAIWCLFKAIQIMNKAKSKEESKEVPAYLIAFFFLAYMGWYFMLQLP